MSDTDVLISGLPEATFYSDVCVLLVLPFSKIFYWEQKKGIIIDVFL